MIKIAFVIDTIESPTAGTEKQLLLLIKSLDRTKFEPYLCVLRTSEWLEQEFSGCKCIDIGFLSFKQVTSYFQLLKFAHFLRKEKIDIIQTFFKDGNKIGVLAGKLGGVRSIVSTRRNQGYWHKKSELFILSILNNLVNKFLANSYSTKNWVVRTEKINPDKIVVIPNALECENFYRATEEQRKFFREQLGFFANAILIGLVANLRPVKSIDVLIEAANIVVQSCPLAGFVIVGEGPERASLEQLCRSMKLHDSVRFLGKRTDIPHVLSCLDIGVLTSSSESFSNAILEYMAAGLAVVCSDVGGAREAVEDGMNGFVVEPGNYQQVAAQIIALIENNRFADMGQAGNRRALRMFSCEAIVSQYQCFYQQIP